jgi:CDP-diacylglycerol--glycerol-3-phosphate 3-phosphatidyltransferase
MSPPVNQHREPADEAGDRFQFNVPNALCAVRLAGSLGLVAVALLGRPMPFLALFLLLAATDWIDGRLAAWLDQRTTFGARFDSVADAAMYGALLFGCIWLKGDVLVAEAAWIAAALATYFVSCLSALIKFGRLPSHHTYSAKLAWLLTVIAGASLLVDWAIWPLRVAAVAISLANLESTLVTFVSKQWMADVPTVWHATRRN